MAIMKNGVRPGPEHIKLLPSGKSQMHHFFQAATKLMELHLRSLVKKSLTQIVDYFNNYKAKLKQLFFLTTLIFVYKNCNFFT